MNPGMSRASTPFLRNQDVDGREQQGVYARLSTGFGAASQRPDQEMCRGVGYVCKCDERNPHPARRKRMDQIDLQRMAAQGVPTRPIVSSIRHGADTGSSQACLI